MSGEYVTLNNTFGNIPDTTVLKLNCDKSFSERSNFFLAYGKWRQDNAEQLILIYDSTIFNSKSNLKKTATKLRIKKERLYWKGITNHQFNKMIKEIEKGAGEGQNTSKKSYDRRKNFYKKVIGYDCK